MLNINLNNIETVILGDPKVRKLLPEFSYIFNQWLIAKKTPALRFLGKKSVMDLLNQLSNKHLKILENYFDDEVEISKFDYQKIKHMTIPLEEAEEKLKEFQDYYFSTYRDESLLYISFWR